MDSTYLKQTVGEPLAEAMAAAVIARPADLTGFIAEYLDNYVKVQEYLVQAAEQKAAVAAAREEAAAINKAASAAAAAVAAEKTAALTELQLLSIVPEPEPKGPIVISNHFKYKDPADKEKVDAILDKIIAYNTEKEMFGPVASTFSFAHEEDGLSYRATEVFPDAAAYETYAGSFSTCPFMEEIMSMVGMVEAVNVEAVTAEDGTVTAEAISGEVLYGELAEMDKSEKLKEFYPTQTRVYAAPGGKGPDMSLFPGVGQFGWTDRAPEAEPETEAEPEGEAEAEAEPEAEGEAEPEPEPPTPLINPEVFPAVIDTLLKHTGFSSVYIASVELKEGVAVEPAEGEEPVPAGMVAALTYQYASAGDAFLVGTTQEPSVTGGAVTSRSAVSVGNVLTDPAVSYYRMQQFGAYACAPVVHPRTKVVLFMVCADTLKVGGPLLEADVEFLTAAAKAIAPPADPDFDLIMNADLEKNIYPAALMEAARAADHTSLCAQMCTPEIWEQYKDTVSSGPAKWTIARAINSGVMYPSSFVGCHAGDAESYDEFKDFFYPVIQAYHKGFDIETTKHVTDMDPEKITHALEENTKAKIISTRIRVARNLSMFPLNPGGSKESRIAVTEMMAKVYAGIEGDLAGEFFLHTTMSDEQRQGLIDDHFLFRGKDSMQAASGYHEFWPEGRGIFHNTAKTAVNWVNEGDHLRIISMEQGGDVLAVFTRLAEFAKVVEAGVKAATGVEEAFMKHPIFGCLTCCPSNIGTGMRGSVHILVPKLIATIGFEAIDKMARERNCQARGSSGEHSEVVDRIDVSNWRRIGFPEYQLVDDMIACANFLAEEEDKLPEPEPRDPDLEAQKRLGIIN